MTAAKITTAGVAAAVNASGLGGSVPITHVALGTSAYNPTGAETALGLQREIAAVASGSTSGPGLCNIRALFPAAGFSGSPYDIGEIGFFSGNPASGGVLFAVASAAGANYGRRSAIDLAAVMDLALTGVPSGSITLTVDPTASVAHVILANHEAAADPHAQYLKKAGGTMVGTLTLAADAATDLQAAPRQQVSSIATSVAAAAVANHEAAANPHPQYANAVPVGAVMVSALAAPPSGWLECNGAAVSRTTYAALWAAIGGTYGNGAGSGSNLFNVPDLRSAYVIASLGGSSTITLMYCIKT